MNLNKTFSWHYASTLVNTITNLIHSHTHVYCTMKGRENLHVNFYPNDFHCLLCKIVWSYQGQMAHTTMWTIRVQNTSRPLANFRTINQNDHAKCYVVSLFVWTMNLGWAMWVLTVPRPSEYMCGKRNGPCNYTSSFSDPSTASFERTVEPWATH